MSHQRSRLTVGQTKVASASAWRILSAAHPHSIAQAPYWATQNFSPGINVCRLSIEPRPIVQFGPNDDKSGSFTQETSPMNSRNLEVK